MVFEDMNWSIEETECASAALDLHKSTPFDLLLVDKNLPDMDGVELIRQVREYDGQSKIIMMTGYASLQSALTTANLRIDAYIEKPFRDISSVCEVVESALGRETSALSLRVGQMFANTTTRSGQYVPLEFPKSMPPQSKPVLRPVSVLVFSRDAAFNDRAQLILNGENVKLKFVESTELLCDEVLASQYDAVMIHTAVEVLELVEQIMTKKDDLSIIVASESMDVGTVQKLIEKRVTAILDKSPTGRQFGMQLRKLLRVI